MYVFGRRYVCLDRMVDEFPLCLFTQVQTRGQPVDCAQNVRHHQSTKVSESLVPLCRFCDFLQPVILTSLCVPGGAGHGDNGLGTGAFLPRLCLAKANP